jgi:hypothetical protein
MGVSAKMHEQLEFEILLSNPSVRFINLPADRIDFEIEDAQRKICECLGIDHSALWQSSSDVPRTFVLSHLYRDQKLPPEDVVVQVGKERMQVKHWEAARGQYADLALFILIDDVLDPSTGGLFGDVKEFIQSQPPTTLVGVGYMRNGTVSVSIPVSKHQSLKFSYSYGAYATFGGDFQNVSVAWQYSWIGRPN